METDESVFRLSLLFCHIHYNVVKLHHTAYVRFNAIEKIMQARSSG